MLDVITIGAATVDIFIKSKKFVVKKDPEYLTGQSLSVAYSSKNEIDQSLICSGGGATNAAVSFSRLELKSSCLSLIGDDPLSNYIYLDLSKNKVNRALLATEHNTSDFSVIMIASDGGRTIFTNRGTTCLENKHFHWSKLPLPQWFYITSLEGNLNLLEKIIGFAKENNIKISLNPGNRELDQLKYLHPLIKQVDFLLLNKTEAQVLIKSTYDDPDFWQKLKSLGCPLIAVTKGRQGAHILSVSGDYFSPIINTHPVDETGAGDAFGSTFVASLIHGNDIPTSLHWAIKNSASVVSNIGAKPGLLTLKQITHAS